MLTHIVGQRGLVGFGQLRERFVPTLTTWSGGPKNERISLDLKFDLVAEATLLNQGLRDANALRIADFDEG